jgi:hypothetical protein
MGTFLTSYKGTFSKSRDSLHLLGQQPHESRYLLSIALRFNRILAYRFMPSSNP